MKKNIVITILAILVVGLGCTLVYVLFNKDNAGKEEAKNETVEKETEKNEELKTETIEEEIEKTENNSALPNSVTIETRTCTGKYSGGTDAPHSSGKVEVELKPSGAYLVGGYEMGTYIIFDGALLTKTPADVCEPGKTCYAHYSLNSISEDCSTILWSYNSYTVELTKQN